MVVDLNSIKSQLSAGQTSNSNEVTPVYPRNTEFEYSVHKTSVSPVPTELAKPTEIKPFGYDVFANAPSTFSPTSDIAIPENYILGLGDRISIQVFGKENMELELDVNREGDAYKLGPYTLSSLSSITHALFAAGGIDDIGSLRNIQLKRSGKLVTKLDLYDLLIRGDSTNDLMLQSGDVVFIPSVENIVTVKGLVRRPSIYKWMNKKFFMMYLIWQAVHYLRPI